MTLHIINRLSNSQSHLENCLKSTVDGDSVVVLSEEYSDDEEESIVQLLKEAHLKEINIAVLTTGEKNINPNVLQYLKSINDKDLVTLSITHQKSITWF